MSKSLFLALILVVSAVVAGCEEPSKAPETPAPAVTEPAAPSALPSPLPAQVPSPLPTLSAIATLVEPEADVKVRRAEALIWKDAVAGAALSNRDAVKTGQSSSAVVRFNDYSELRVEAQSMVIVMEKSVTEKAELTRISLPSGEIQGHIKKQKDRGVEMEVRTARGWIYASTRGKDGKAAAEPVFRVQVSPKGKLEVRSETGLLTVRMKGQEQVVHPHETFSVKEPAQPPQESDTEALPVVSASEWKLTKAAEKAPAGDTFKILRPANKSEVHSESVAVEGRLSGRLKAYLNGVEIVSKPDGSFSTQVRLVPGANTLTFQIMGPGTEDVRYQSLELIRKSE